MSLLMGENGQLLGLSPQLWHVLDQLGILMGNLFMAASLVLAVLGFLKREQLHRWWHRNRFPEIGGKAPRDCDGLILTFSRIDLPRWVIEQLKPDWVGLLPSQETRDQAEQLAGLLRRHGYTVHLRTIDDPDDPAQARLRTQELLQQAHHEGCRRPLVDLTGGKVPMSIGVFMAAEERGAPSLYVTADYDPKHRRIRPGSQRITLISNPEAAP